MDCPWISLPCNVNAHLVKIHTRSTLRICYKTRVTLWEMVNLGPLVLCIPSSIAMRFTALCAIVAAAATSVGGVPTASAVLSRDISLSLNLPGLLNGFDLSNTNHYGAPIPPWEPGSKPGWYYGPHPGDHPDLPCLGGVCIMVIILKYAWHRV